MWLVETLAGSGRTVKSILYSTTWPCRVLKSPNIFKLALISSTMAFQVTYQLRIMNIVLILLLSLNYVSSLATPRQPRDTKLQTPAQKFSFNSELGLSVPDPWKAPSGIYFFQASNYRAPYISLLRAYQIHAYLVNDALDEVRLSPM